MLVPTEVTGETGMISWSGVYWCSHRERGISRNFATHRWDEWVVPARFFLSPPGSGWEFGVLDSNGTEQIGLLGQLISHES